MCQQVIASRLHHTLIAPKCISTDFLDFLLLLGSKYLLTRPKLQPFPCGVVWNAKYIGLECEVPEFWVLWNFLVSVCFSGVVELWIVGLQLPLNPVVPLDEISHHIRL